MTAARLPERVRVRNLYGEVAVTDLAYYALRVTDGYEVEAIRARLATWARRSSAGGVTSGDEPKHLAWFRNGQRLESRWPAAPAACVLASLEPQPASNPPRAR